GQQVLGIRIAGAQSLAKRAAQKLAAGRVPPEWEIAKRKERQWILEFHLRMKIAGGVQPLDLVAAPAREHHQIGRRLRLWQRIRIARMVEYSAGREPLVFEH